MDMLSIHKTALACNVASYHEFLMRYSTTNNIVYGFVEGKEDPCFYKGFIQSLIPDDWDIELWPAGNKNQVYKIYESMDWQRFPQKRICFFVDRDLSELIPRTLHQDFNIYITEGYSIENEVVNRNTCHRLLTEIYGFANIEHKELDRICDLFEEELEKFLIAALPIMAWILFWLRNNKEANLNNIEISKFFVIKAGRLEMKTALTTVGIAEYIHKKCKIVYDQQIDISSYETALKKEAKYRKFTRGKYIFWFLLKFCDSVRENAKILFNSCPNKVPSMKITLSTSNGMMVAGNRSRLPNSLREFLQKTFCEYITSKPAQ